MLDRESTFADEEIVRLLKTQFVPVAIDQAAQRRQRDAEGEFYRKIAGQAHDDFDGTTQGFYIATAGGKLLLYNNNRDPAKLRRLMHEELQEFERLNESQTKVAPLASNSTDRRFTFHSPEGGLVVRVRAKVLGGYAETSNRWKQIFQSAVSRDNLWISAAEHQQLAKGNFPSSLQRRMARFHLVDNTRGEPPMWLREDIEACEFQLETGLVTGAVKLANARSDRGFDAAVRGHIEVRAGEVVRFDLVAQGDFWGEGPYTRGAPEGKFPLLITFELADGSDLADSLPPQGARGWLDGYLRN